MSVEKSIKAITLEHSGTNIGDPNKSASITLWCGCTWLLARLSLVGYTPMGFPIAAIGRRALWPVMDGAETNLYLSEVTEKLKKPLFRKKS